MEATVSDGFVPNQIGIEPKPLHVSVLTGEQASGLLQCHKGEKFWWFGKIKFLFLSLRARIRMKCQQGVFSWPFLLMGFYKIRVWAPVANFFGITLSSVLTERDQSTDDVCVFVISWIFTVSCVTELSFYRHVRCSVVSTSTSIRHWIQTYFIHQRSHPTYTCCMKYGKQYVEYEAYLMATVQNFDNFYCNIIIVNVYDFVLLGNKKQKKPKAMWQ